VTETLEQVSDAELISAVRHGDVSAFGALYERHLSSAKRAAACLAKTPSEREDLVAEAFTRVLRILREGRGPDEEFRPYLLVTLRNAAIHSTTRGAPVSLYADVPDTYRPDDDHPDPVIDKWNAGAAADAFASLPERWRMVLWHTEVEEESPAEVAPLLGMRPNSVAALAYRAREGLRQAYLRMHVPEPPRRECQPTVNKLAGYVRQSIPAPLSRKIARHLERCPDCRVRVAVLTKVNTEIAGLLGPVVLGAPLAAAYLPTSGAALAVSAAADAGLLAVKTLLLKAGATVAIAATAMTTTAATPAEVREPREGPMSITVAEGEREATFTVEGSPPQGGARPSAPAPSTGAVPVDGSVSASDSDSDSDSDSGSGVSEGTEASEASEVEKASSGQTKAERKAARKAAKKAAKKERKAAKRAGNEEDSSGEVAENAG
jgi:RNA polymerase sigma factor (sigma-70 family)